MRNDMQVISIYQEWRRHANDEHNRGCNAWNRVETKLCQRPETSTVPVSRASERYVAAQQSTVPLQELFQFVHHVESGAAGQQHHITWLQISMFSMHSLRKSSTLTFTGFMVSG